MVAETGQARSHRSTHTTPGRRESARVPMTADRVRPRPT